MNHSMPANRPPPPQTKPTGILTYAVRSGANVWPVGRAGSTEILRLLALRDGYIEVEAGNRSQFTLKDRDGRDMAVFDERGRQRDPRLPMVILDDFRRHSFVVADAPADISKSTIYRLTADALDACRV